MLGSLCGLLRLWAEHCKILLCLDFGLVIYRSTCPIATLWLRRFRSLLPGRRTRLIIRLFSHKTFLQHLPAWTLM